LSQKAGARAQVTCGGTGATLIREAGARAAETCGGLGAAPRREARARATGIRGGPGAALPFVLTWSLYAGYLIFRVPTEAPGPISGGVANP
jgi:hypothetical protein